MKFTFMKMLSYICVALLMFNCSSDDTTAMNTEDEDPTTTIDDPIDIPDDPEGLYFPPLTGSEWDTISASDLGWDTTKLAALDTFLADNGTKGFMILKDGKIVSESYYNGHTQDAVWTWFSAGKSLTATAVGIAQDEGLLNIHNKTSDYLGDSWSSLTTEQQDLITVKNHLTMTTGLEDNIEDFIPWTCPLPECLTYNSDAGTRWVYHQGAFSLLFDILDATTGTTYDAYIQSKILNKIGMTGSWNTTLFLNIFSSNTRSMARFGLLMLNKGTWDETPILSETYFNEMTTTSQTLNEAYGYLWWLNGKDSFISTDTMTYEGSLIPNAPNDMIAALGAQDQKIYVIPSENLVVVRCGTAASDETFASSSFDNELWGKLNEIKN